MSLTTEVFKLFNCMIYFHPEARGAAAQHAHAIEKVCPAVLTTKRGPSASGKYQIFPTTTVIADLQKKSWLPVEIQGHPKNPFARHLVRFRQRDSEGEEWPEIIVVNSHDGLSSFQLTTGVFRLVCANGLIAAQTVSSALRVCAVAA